MLDKNTFETPVISVVSVLSQNGRPGWQWFDMTKDTWTFLNDYQHVILSGMYCRGWKSAMKNVPQDGPLTFPCKTFIFEQFQIRKHLLPSRLSDQLSIPLWLKLTWRCGTDILQNRCQGWQLHKRVIMWVRASLQKSVCYISKVFLFFVQSLYLYNFKISKIY